MTMKDLSFKITSIAGNTVQSCMQLGGSKVMLSYFTLSSLIHRHCAA